jgi:hypothetical protein
MLTAASGGRVKHPGQLAVEASLPGMPLRESNRVDGRPENSDAGDGQRRLRHPSPGRLQDSGAPVWPRPEPMV